MSIAIVWFRQDLRLHDNEALAEALRQAEVVIPVYVADPDLSRTGPNRLRFIRESVLDLRQRLRALGSELLIREGNAAEQLYRLALESKSNWVFCNRERTRDEVMQQDQLESRLWTIGRELRYSRGKMLFHTADLPFPVTHCPAHFASFRKEVEALIPVRAPLPAPAQLPPVPAGIEPGDWPARLTEGESPPAGRAPAFIGGETEGLRQLAAVRDCDLGLSERAGSMLSPWISLGCLSPKEVYHAVADIEPSGELIRQRLVIRDHLRLMGKKYGDRIFHFSGIQGVSPARRRDEAAWKSWRDGQTGIPVIDAAMHQLRAEGWMPDVLRRLSAGYLIRGLGLDWRLGAAWFEYCLLDYDPCSNWVSWQNAAGVGPDPRDERITHFDVVARRLDPDGHYVRQWGAGPAVEG